MAFGQYLTSIQNTLSKLFKTNEVNAKPLNVSSQPVAPIPQQDVVNTQRQSFENQGGLSPIGGNIPSAPVQPTPTPTPQSTFPDVTQYGIPQPSEQVMNLLMTYFPQEEWENAARVAFGESSYNPQAVNTESGATGLFQINPYPQRENLSAQGFAPQDMFDLEKNIQFASWLQGKQNWQPWEAAQKLGIVQ